MNRYEELVLDLRERTVAKEVVWRRAARKVLPFVLNPDEVVREFTAQLQIGEEPYRASLIERRAPWFDEDGYKLTETLQYELYILDHNDELVFGVEGRASPGEMMRLATAVEETNEQASQFFELLDQQTSKKRKQ